MSIWWKLGGVLLLGVAAYFMVTMYGKARYERGRADERVAWQDKVIEAERGKLAAFQAGLARVQAAETVYHETIRTLPPITNTIVERSTRYASTPEGAALCLPADRGGLLAETRRALFPPAPATPADGSAGTVPADGAGREP